MQTTTIIKTNIRATNGFKRANKGDNRQMVRCMFEISFLLIDQILLD